jgi:hypothetical protein
VKYSAMRRCWQIHTSPLVNTSVRSGEMSASRSSDSTPHGSIVVVHHFPLRRLTLQFL